MTPDVPRQLSDVDAAWMSAALDDSFPGIQVAAVEVSTVTYGSACRALLAITYEPAPDGLTDPPRSVMLKTSLPVEIIQGNEMPEFWLPTMTALNSAEVQFYRRGAGTAIMGDRVPHAWFAGQDSGRTAVLMENLTGRQDWRFGVFDKPFDEDTMAGVLEVLARLHAARWADPELVAHPLPDTLTFGMLDALVSEENWNEQMSRPRGEHLPPELADRRRVAAALQRITELKQTGPVGLLHGDPHIGNTFFDIDGPGLFDWQLYSSGQWAYDVVWSMAGAMTIEDRRRCERDLLGHYLEALAGHGVKPPSSDEAWQSYRTFAIAGVLNFLTPGDTVQTEAYNSTVGERHATAALDLETLQLLGV